jgi:DNA-binding CsgD family transcriptional regulator
LVYPDGVTAPASVGGFATRSLSALRDGDIAGAQAAADTARALADARSVAERHRDPAGLAELGWAESWLERYSAAEGHLRAGIAAARRGGRDDLLPRMLVALAHVACWTGRLPDAVQLARGARRHGDTDVRCAAAALESIATLWIGGQSSQARSLELARAAVGVAGFDSWWGRVAIASLGQARLFSDDAAGCVRLVLDAGKDTELSGLPVSLRPMWFSLLCAAALRTGDVDGADVWARRADAVRRHIELPGQRAFAAMATGQVLLRHGDAAGAALRLRAAAAGFGQSGMGVLGALALVVGARATAAAGDLVTAAGMLRCAHRAAVACGSQRIVDMAARGMPGPVSARTVGVPRQRLSVRSGSPARPSAVAKDPPDPATTTAPPDDRLRALTAREREIAGIAATGTKTRTIARQLGVSPRTVDVHLSRIYRKLAVSGRSGLVIVVGMDQPGTP